MKRGWVKGICAVLCVLLLTAGVCGGGFALSQWDVAFSGSAACRALLEEDCYTAELLELYRLSGQTDLTGELQQELAQYAQRLDPARTNFRYRLRARDGTVLGTNLPEEEQGRTLQYREMALNIGQYDGSRYLWADSYFIEYGVAEPLRVQDAYAGALAEYEELQGALPGRLCSAAGALISGLVLLTLLLCTAGRRPGQTDAVQNVQDRIPYDLYLAAAVFAGAFLLAERTEAEYHYRISGSAAGLVTCCVLSVGVTAVAVAALLTTATRIKAGTLFRNTVLWRAGKGAVRAVRTLPLVWRAGGLFFLYLLGRWAVAATTPGLLPIYEGFVLWLVCRWVLQWRQIRQATEAIVAGQTDVKIDHTGFYPDLCRHAEQLNDLGGAIDHAVEARLKSERFKAELITNASHDLKTPLTSIINYVDLLKKEKIQDPKVLEYVEVLDRKSQRLKKLTEDLMEAAKASSGVLAVNRERLNLAQLAGQAAGEYEERLSAAGLTLVTTLPEEAVQIHADGRHVWRVLDNLLGNCAKYALEGSRVYLEVSAWDGNAVLTLKNISRQPLNIPVEQLMERFVRGG